MRIRYRWDTDAKALVEIGAEAISPARLELMTGSFYDGTVATDGTPIDARWKYQEYMRRNEVTHASDYTESLQKAKARRIAFYQGSGDIRHVREAVARAFHERFKP